MHDPINTASGFSDIKLRSHHDTVWELESSIVPKISNIPNKKKQDRLFGIGGNGDEERKVTFVGLRDLRRGERGFKLGETK